MSLIPAHMVGPLRSAHNRLNKFLIKCLKAAPLLLSLGGTSLVYGQWTMITKPATAPASFGTMIMLSDGSIMVLNGDDSRHWMLLSPDKTGSYANGKFKDIKEMSIGRLYFASEVLPDGRIWVLGGEYTGPTGPYITRTDTPSGEIYDPIANSWSPIAPYPDMAGCPANTDYITSDVNLVNGSKKVGGIYSTYRVLAGWTVTGPGIPAGTTVVSVDSEKKVTISNPATFTGASKVSIAGTASSCYGAIPAILLPGGKNVLAGSIVDGSTYYLFG